jgi:hypothetical protein
MAVSTKRSLPYSPYFWFISQTLNNVPRFFGSMAEFATGNTGTQAVIADTDRVVLERIREVIPSLGHGTNEHADALSGTEGLNVIPDTDHGRIETKGDFAAIRWEMISDGIFDDLQQFFLRVGGSDG